MVSDCNMTINIVRLLNSGWQKMAASLSVVENDTHSPCSAVQFLSTECHAGYDVSIIQLHKMKQIIIRERKIEYKNSESNRILDARGGGTPANFG